MNNKIVVVAKIILSITLSLIWFVLIQVEYEMITKPELQSEFPIIKGHGAVYFTGIILLIITAGIFLLARSIRKSIGLNKTERNARQ